MVLHWQWLINGEVYVMDDIKLALLGNKEAAKRLTEAGGGCWRVRFAKDMYVE